MTNEELDMLMSKEENMVDEIILNEEFEEQNSFNEDTIEQLLEDGELDEVAFGVTESVEGIGSTNFTIRTKKPSVGNKCYIRKASGGWSTCITGKPTDKDCDVLSNCVGYGTGRFNEVYNEIKGTTGMKYPMNTNAENFIELAKSYGLEIGQTPKPGALMCWQKGATLSGSDGAGHICLVERVNNSNSVYTSESGWNSSTPFWNATRTNSNGRWGAGSGYTFRGFIYNPAVEDTPQPEPTPTPVDEFNIGDKVVINGPLYANSNAASPAGGVSNKVTNITRKVSGAKHPYNTTGDLGWMDASSIKKYVEPTPEPTPVDEFKVGDKVVPTKLVNYRGTRLVQYDKFYYITELVGDRAVLSALRNGKYIIWASMNTANIKKI